MPALDLQVSAVRSAFGRPSRRVQVLGGHRVLGRRLAIEAELLHQRVDLLAGHFTEWDSLQFLVAVAQQHELWVGPWEVFHYQVVVEWDVLGDKGLHLLQAIQLSSPTGLYPCSGQAVQTVPVGPEGGGGRRECC